MQSRKTRQSPGSWRPLFSRWFRKYVYKRLIQIECQVTTDSFTLQSPQYSRSLFATHLDICSQICQVYNETYLQHNRTRKDIHKCFSQITLPYWRLTRPAISRTQHITRGEFQESRIKPRCLLCWLTLQSRLQPLFCTFPFSSSSPSSRFCSVPWEVF